MAKQVGLFLIIIGILITIIGVVMVLFPKFPLLGKLPGDIIVKKENFAFYFPLVSCIILSIIISLILYFIRK